MAVVFPAPLGPKSAQTEPAGVRKLTSSKASLSPKALVTLRNSTALPAGAPVFTLAGLNVCVEGPLSPLAGKAPAPSMFSRSLTFPSPTIRCSSACSA